MQSGFGKGLRDLYRRFCLSQTDLLLLMFDNGLHDPHFRNVLVRVSVIIQRTALCCNSSERSYKVTKFSTVSPTISSPATSHPHNPQNSEQLDLRADLEYTASSREPHSITKSDDYHFVPSLHIRSVVRRVLIREH